MRIQWLLQVCKACTLLVALLPCSEGRECLKRDVIGHREGNVYRCDHPTYSECCEHHDRFTCCEPDLWASLVEQLQLWGMVMAMVAVGCLVYLCCFKDTAYIQAETLRGVFGKKEKKTPVGKGKKMGPPDVPGFGSYRPSPLTITPLGIATRNPVPPVYPKIIV